MSARRPGETSRRGLDLFHASPAVLPPLLRQCGLGLWGRRGRVRLWVRGPPPLLRRPLCGGEGEGEGVRGACSPPTCRPSAEAAAKSAGGGGLKTSGSNDGVALPGGWCRGVSRCGQRLRAPRGGGGAHGDRLRAVAPPLLAGVRRSLLYPHPLAAAPRPHGPPG